MRKWVVVMLAALSLVLAMPNKGWAIGLGPAFSGIVQKNAENKAITKADSTRSIANSGLGQQARKAPASRGTADVSDAGRLIRFAMSLKGSPYRGGGVSPAGFDCSGFTTYVFRNGAGIELPRTSGQQAKTGTAVARDDLRPGDIVYFNTSGRGVSHVGIYIGGDNFISSTSSKGVKVDSLNGGYWGNRYLGARRIGR